MGGKAVPLILLNMGGEMIYIINQRLGAQGIPPEKGEKGIFFNTGSSLSQGLRVRSM
jgi:hypothetical protein